MNPISIGLLYFFGKHCNWHLLRLDNRKLFQIRSRSYVRCVHSGVNINVCSDPIIFYRISSKITTRSQSVHRRSRRFCFWTTQRQSCVYADCGIFNFVYDDFPSQFLYVLSPKTKPELQKNLEPEKVPENFLAFLINFIFNIATFGGIPIVTCCAYFWTKDLFFSFQIGLGTTAIGILGHAIKALFQRDLSWSFYAFLLCFNFAAWIFALEFFEFM